MMNANASELFHEMLADIAVEKRVRTTGDPLSPASQELSEATLGRTYVLRNPAYNLMDFRVVDLRWAVANVLHFFTAAEEATSLLRYNRYAEKFLTKQPCAGCFGKKVYSTGEPCEVCEGKGERWFWIGAYGVVIVPQLLHCINHLKQHPQSRAAIITMPGLLAGRDYNRPACWSSLHLLQGREGLDLLVYQRSLHITRVGPYDCIALTNILLFAAAQLGVPVGYLRWFVGSVHCELPVTCSTGNRHKSIHLPDALLADSAACAATLADPNKLEALL